MTLVSFHIYNLSSKRSTEGASIYLSREFKIRTTDNRTIFHILELKKDLLLSRHGR